jgi:hypothetical protein
MREAKAEGLISSNLTSGIMLEEIKKKKKKKPQKFGHGFAKFLDFARARNREMKIHVQIFDRLVTPFV